MFAHFMSDQHWNDAPPKTHTSQILILSCPQLHQASWSLDSVPVPSSIFVHICAALVITYIIDSLQCWCDTIIAINEEVTSPHLEITHHVKLSLHVRMSFAKEPKCAGCRVSLSHWTARHQNPSPLHGDCQPAASLWVKNFQTFLLIMPLAFCVKGHV